MRKTLIILSTLFCLIHSSVTQAQIGGSWKQLGYTSPLKRGPAASHGIQRITQVKFHPTDPKKMYAVAIGGGLFTSNDEGNNWNATGTQNMPHSYGSSVCIDYTNDRILYFGTGDPNYYVMTEYQRSLGVWKSTDGGMNWANSNTGMGNLLVVEILMSPTDHNVLLAATEAGVYKSIDGGANWTIKSNTPPRITDMVFKAGPNNTTVFIATATELWSSPDMGDNWNLVTLPVTVPILTNDNAGGRIGVSKANPNVVYVSFIGDWQVGKSTAVLKSTDGGANFVVSKPFNAQNLNGYTDAGGGQNQYNYAMTVDPLNANTVYVVGHRIMKSVNSGVDWTELVDGNNFILHTDMHQIVFSPYDNTKLYNANDGGLFINTDGTAKNWTQRNDGLGGLEAYTGAVSPLKKNQVILGAQDNGQAYFDGTNWMNVDGGDGEVKLAFDYQNADKAYVLSGTGHSITLSTAAEPPLTFPFDCGGIGAKVEIEFTPLNTSLAFVGFQDIYRTTNLSAEPPTWNKISSISSVIQALALSPTDANVLYVVTDDNKIRRSDNALSATPTFPAASTYTTPGSTNTNASVAVIKSNTSIVYLTCGGNVYRSTNKGASWTDITSNLSSSVNIMKIIHDVYSTNESVYIATANGVYYKNNTMTTWLNYSSGLPTFTNITNLMIYNDGTQNASLYVSMSGRGAWKSSLNGFLPTLRDPENPSISAAGLNYEYYEGTWNYLPNFNSLSSVKKGTVTNFDITPRKRDTNIAFQYTGYINVPTDGAYTFYTSSDDGSQLYIGRELIVNNDGLHTTATEQSGTLGLKAGKHAMTVLYFNSTAPQSISVSYAGPGITKIVIPASALFKLPDPIVCTGTGSISRDYWQNVTGANVSDIPVATATTTTNAVSVFEEPNTENENFGVRMRGYICAPYTGNYTFWIASDNSGELWLSTDMNPANKTKIAFNTSFTGIRDWNRYTSQKSASIPLVAGQKYYIEGLQKRDVNTVNDFPNFSVGWQLPSGEFERPIPGSRLSSFNTSPVVSIKAPANNAIFSAPVNIPLTATTSELGGTISKVDYYNGTTLIGSSTTGTTYPVTWNNVVAGNYVLTAIATDKLGVTTTSTVVNITVNPAATLPSPWVQGDIGTVAFTGSCTYASGTSTFTSNGAGADIWSTADAFHYVYQPVSGNTEIIAKVNSLTNTDVWTKCGVMVRETLNANSKNAFMLVTPTITNGYAFQTRSTTGGTTLKSGAHTGTGTTVPMWLKLNRTGDVFSAYQSTDGVTWGTAVGTVTVSMTANVYVGMALTAHTTSAIATAAFSNVSVTGSNAAPSVSITSPANNATILPGNITLTANATDSDGTISKVEFFNGSTSIGVSTSTASPYSLTWANVAAGTYALTAKATDNKSAITTSTAVNITVATNVAPTVSITSPANNATIVPGNITLTANATDSDGTISKVEFFNGSTSIGVSTSTASPYSLTWTNVVAGTYVLTAKATDNKSAITTSAIVTITVAANVAPTVSIGSPANNASIPSGTITLSANATDNDGTISKVEFFKGGVSIGVSTSTASPYTYTWTSVAAGTYVLTAKATDNKGAITTSANVNITVTSSGTCTAAQWTAGNATYTTSTVVKNTVGTTVKRYQCTIPGWCQSTASSYYEPGNGSNWTDCWTDLGVCTSRTGAVSPDDNTATNYMEVYPNPTGNIATIRGLSASNTVNINVINSLGMEVLNKEIQSSNGEFNYQIDLTNLPQDVYTIKASFGETILTNKLVKIN
jgi:hypothetical protein